MFHEKNIRTHTLSWGYDRSMTIARGEERLLEVDRSVSLFRMEAFQVRASTIVTVVFAIVITVHLLSPSLIHNHNNYHDHWPLTNDHGHHHHTQHDQDHPNHITAPACTMSPLRRSTTRWPGEKGAWTSVCYHHRSCQVKAFDISTIFKQI